MLARIRRPLKLESESIDGTARIAEGDPVGIYVGLRHVGGRSGKGVIHMHLNFGLFADILRELAATVGRIPKDEVMHRDQLAKAVAELHTALTKV